MSEVLYGSDLFGASAEPKRRGPIAEKFLIPPFSALDARSGNWQDRKRAWLSLGIKSEVGRDAPVFNTTIHPFDEYDEQPGQVSTIGTSIFDPVLCELVYRWFSVPGGWVIDPFAGGSVRGIVASHTGLRYWGVDLRQEQIDANQGQAEICADPAPVWVCGDSASELASAPRSDIVFSCPPYGDLEVYSNHPSDLSGMAWEDFLAAYRAIIRMAVAGLNDNRFACFVVGDFRDQRGFYRNFVSQTIQAFEDAGARLYNEAILVTSVGSASMRVTKQFEASRKLAKTHQNVLVFCKGDPKAATAACKEVV